MIKKLTKLRHQKWLVTTRQNLLAFGGCFLISWGVALIFWPAGVITAGVLLLLMEWRLDDE